MEDDKLDTFERISNVWMKATRGDIASRFDKIKDTYLEVTESIQDQIQREQLILDAYRDYRGAQKQAEILALEVLQVAQGKLDQAKIHTAQGIEVTDHALREGVAALKEDRFVYKPPKTGFSRSLARVYASRGHWFNR